MGRRRRIVVVVVIVVMEVMMMNLEICSNQQTQIQEQTKSALTDELETGTRRGVTVVGVCIGRWRMVMT